MTVNRRGKSWTVSVELGRDPSTGKRRRAFATLPTKREAEQEEARLRHQAATGLDLEPAKLSVADYIERWLDTMRTKVAPSTFQRYQGLLRYQVVPHIGGINLTALRPLHVQQLYGQLREAGRAHRNGGLSARTIVHVHRVLSEALRHAVLWQLLARNVCDAVEPPHPPRAEMRALQPEEARHLLKIVDSERSSYATAVIVALHTGLRLGEILGLKWQDIDLDGARLTVQRSLQYLPSQGICFRNPKTNGSRRTIPLGATVVGALHRQRRRQLEERLRIGSAYESQDLVFTDAVGGPLAPYRVSQRFRAMAEKAGVGGLRFHDLRHAHATLLLSRGVHPKIVSERLGHASIAVTMDIYAHALPSLQEAAVRELDGWLASDTEIPCQQDGSN